jgi:hypothetical protein
MTQDRGQEYPTYNKTMGGYTDWSYLAQNYLLKRVIEGKIEGKKRRGRRRKQLLDNLKET